jgi:DNA-binding winged helix-turn-helix (wHTH) protein
MTPVSIQFEDFLLDRADRQLRRGGEAIELNSRYFDALALLVADRGRLVPKDRFLKEVWAGVPVTDEALTQCIKTLRRQLGDDASNPRFIETVPKHGYRFIAEVKANGSERRASSPANRDFLKLTAAGTLGGGVAGLSGGLLYGAASASQPVGEGSGAVSVLIVLLALTVIIALVGSAGVSAGMAASQVWKRGPWWATVGGGALGGLLVGAFVRLLGIDAFNLLFGSAPSGMTGGLEGAMLGATAGLALWRAGRLPEKRLRVHIAVAGALGALAGAAIIALGGHLLGGSLDLLAHEFDQSRLRLGRIGGLLGENGFGPLSQLFTGALEAGLFTACVVGAILFAQRRLHEHRN